MSTQLTAEEITGSGEVFDYYAKKMADVMRKYGPGPRVHFHLGLFPADAVPNTSVPRETLRQRLVEAQENMLDFAADVWGVAASPPRRILDVGCGLGGGSIYWAQRFGSAVTAVTNMPGDVPLVKELVARAEMSHLVEPLLMDAHDMDLPMRHNAAVAFESVCHMDRRRVFPAVARALERGGWFALEDHFLLRGEWAGTIDGYYRTNLGSVQEYQDIAASCGFVLEHNTDITDQVVEFWVQSMAWTASELDHAYATQQWSLPERRLTDSAVAHGRFFRAWRDRAVETRLLLFRLRG
ncbi:SAM-dependent methyltransferase [Streptomyces sp. CB02923]|uniref:SAM-dependent methyltransferase n=1 Tax=Streptomyces sp. CB02923 TaxID=1718985 RepID=UPI001F5B6932|nr:methyltransferase domain-containing protein [Streptomyces sp. CB02923]